MEKEETNMISLYSWNDCTNRTTYCSCETNLIPTTIVVVIMIIIIIVAVQPFVGPWLLFQFLDPIHRP
jgi:hypothetical protein